MDVRRGSLHHSHTTPTRKSPSRRVKAAATTARPSVPRQPAASRERVDRLTKRLDAVLATEAPYIENESFVGRRDNVAELSTLAHEVELGSGDLAAPISAGLPAHLGRMCATPLLTVDQEQELFRRMNFCKYRANALRSRLSRSNPDEAKIAEVEGYLARAGRLRNYIIQANTRLVMSIARRFADNRNGFDDLLSQGLASLMHSVEKFDYSRGYRFSTYATCAVRRDLYRMVMGLKKDQQRYSTGAGEYLDGCSEEPAEGHELTESTWNHLTESLQEMMQELDERERFIVTYRFGLDESGKKSSYSRLGERLGISKERVRQLANRALDKMRELAPEYRLEALLA